MSTRLQASVSGGMVPGWALMVGWLGSREGKSPFWGGGNWGGGWIWAVGFWGGVRFVLVRVDYLQTAGRICMQGIVQLIGFMNYLFGCEM